MFPQFTFLCHNVFNDDLHNRSFPVELDMVPWKFHVGEEPDIYGRYRFGTWGCQTSRWQTIMGGRLLNMELGIPFDVYACLEEGGEEPVQFISALHWDKLELEKCELREAETFNYSMKDGMLVGSGYICFEEDNLPIGHPVVLRLECAVNLIDPYKICNIQHECACEHADKKTRYVIHEQVMGETSDGF